jgi:hypothetical protein
VQVDVELLHLGIQRVESGKSGGGRRIRHGEHGGKEKARGRSRDAGEVTCHFEYLGGDETRRDRLVSRKLSVDIAGRLGHTSGVKTGAKR